MKRMNRTSETSVANFTHEGDGSSEHRDVGTSSSRRSKLVSNNAWPNALGSSADKTCDTGPENGRLVDYISPETEEFASHLGQVEAECGDSNEEPLPDNIERDHEVDRNQYSGIAEALVSDTFLFKKCDVLEELAFIKQSKDRKLSHLECITGENNDNRMTPQYNTFLHSMVDQCPTGTQALDLKSTLQHSSFKLTEAKKELSDKFGIIRSQSSDKQMPIMPCILTGCHKGKTALNESPSGNGISLKERKGKEKVNGGGNKIASMGKDDSHESAESSNSKEPCAKGKRAWNYGQETLMGSKRMRKAIDKNSSSGSHVREDGSFMNWISSVTKGFFRSDHVEKHSLALIPHPVPNTPSNPSSCLRSNERDHNAVFTGMGFGSLFKALYCPKSGKPMKTITSGYQEEYADVRRLPFNDRSAGSVKAVPMSNMRNNQGIYQFREPLLSVPSISLRNSPIQEKMKHNMEEYCNLHNMGSSSSSFQKGCTSPSEGKEVSKIGIPAPNKLSDLSITKKAGAFPVSLWITRFSPKVAAQTSCEKLTDECPNFLHCSQNEMVTVRDCSNSENVHMPSNHQGPYSGDLHELSTSPMDSCGSKKVHMDPTAMFKLNPVLPSHTLKKMEPMTSVFAKRLDAFRHIRTSEVQNDVTPENAICFFCGKNGHSITACSDVSESELKDLMRKVNSYGRTEKTSCICLRCFLHDHWAVACPYASLSHHHRYNNTCDINSKKFFRKIKGHGSDAPLNSYYNIGICSKGDDGQGPFSAHGNPCGETPGTVAEAQTSISVDIVDIINLNGSALSSYLTKDGYRKTEAKGKQVDSTSTEINSTSKLLIPSFDVNNEPDKQCLIFERIKKLRMSRTVIVRWMESSISHFSLVGFFLRVRIGKWEGDQGGTGYHVARISGAPGQKVHGHSKSRLPVDIGGLICLIDCRFISNHDFTEDELHAWWSATLRRGGKLPSTEDLDKKLQEREKFDLLHK